MADRVRFQAFCCCEEFGFRANFAASLVKTANAGSSHQFVQACDKT